MSVATLIAKSREDARSQGLRQFILVERHLCERDLAEIAARNVNDILRYRVPGELQAHNLRAVETSKTMVAWEADDSDPDDVGQDALFSGPAPIKFVTDFEGNVVRVTAPVYFNEVRP